MAGRGLGTLTLDLAVKTGAFEAGMSKAERRLDSSARKMQQRAEKIGRAIGASLAAGIGLAATGLTLYIRNTIEAEKVTAQIVARLRDTGHAAGRTLEQLKAQAEELQRATVFDDEAIGEAQAALLTFTQVTGKEFDRAIESATDLATVMGTDVPAAAKLLGKALADPEKGLGALRKAGVVLSDQQIELVKNLDKAGKQAEAQRIILDALEGKMGTAAEAARDTLGGALQSLQNSFENLLEGDSGDSGMLAAREAVEDLNDSLNDPGVKQGIDNLVAGFFRVAQRAVETAGAIANLVRGVDAFGRSAGQATYDANLRQEQILKDQIANGGRSPFEPGGAKGVQALKQELAVVHQLNEAYRAASQNGRAAPTGKGEPLNDTITISHDPTLFGSGLGGSGKKKKAKAEVDELAEAYKRMNAQMAETIALFNKTGEEAKVRYEIEHGELQKLGEAEKNILILKAQQIDQLAAEKKAREESIRLEEEERKEAEKHAEQIKELLDDIAFETSLTKLSNDEKERAIALRRSLAGATAEEAAQITAAVDELLAAQKHSSELAGAMDDFRASFEDTVTDVLTGSKSIGDAFKSLADTIVAQIARIIAQQLTANLFGGAGSTGGWLGSLFSIFLGGSSSSSGSVSRGGMGFFAEGTNFAPGGPAVVGEHGPEIVNLPRGATVTPNNKLGGNSVTVQIIGGTNPRETAQQAANEVRRVLAFSGRSG